MPRRDFLWLAATFGAGTCLAALSFWPAAVPPAAIADPAFIAALAGLSGLAMMLVVGQVASPVLAGGLMASCLPLATFAQQGAAKAMHPPLMLATAIVAGLAAVTPGVLAGMLVRRLQTRAPN